MRHKNRLKILLKTFLFVISCSHTGCSQFVNTSKTPLSPVVIWRIEDYGRTVKNENRKELILLTSFIASLIIDFKYATYDNFTGQILYVRPRPFARLPAAVALKNVQKELATKGLGLKLFDAYRPWSVTKKMWKVVPDERYAANPAKGSAHNRGIAVDVTLVKISTGEELPMPTRFDDFTEKAHHTYLNLPADVIKNRSLLKSTMEKHGFVALKTEWWHYSLFQPGIDFELLDLSFDDLQQLDHRY